MFVYQVLFVLPLSALVDEAFGDVDWCGKDFECIVNGVAIKHSMCHVTPPSDCSAKNLMDDKVEEEILKLHNDLRHAMEKAKTPPYGMPNACKLRPLEWNTVLADVAKNWAMRCSMVLDPCCNIKEQGKVWIVGKNMQIMKWVGGPQEPRNTIQTSVSFWWKMMGLASGLEGGLQGLAQKYKQGSWDSAAQMIWMDTRYIGCGYTAWKSGDTQYKVLNCLYGPVGIVDGAEMYRICENPASPEDVTPGVSEDAGKIDGEVTILDSAGIPHEPAKPHEAGRSMATQFRINVGFLHLLQVFLVLLPI